MNESTPSGWFTAPLLLLVIFIAATLGPVLLGFDHFPKKSVDHDHHHIPVVLSFAERLPEVDLSDYASATTPGMHLAMAVFLSATGFSDPRATETLLQVCSCFFGVLLVLAAFRYASRISSPWTAFVCVLPVASSPYVLGNAIWVMTDNLSLALIAVTVGTTLFCEANGAFAFRSGVALVCSVFVRQINIWVSGVAMVGYLLQWTPVRRHLTFPDQPQTLGNGFVPMVIFAVATILAAGVIIGFVLLWGGLVPPMFQIGGGGMTHAGGFNYGVTPGVLSLLGVYASPAIVILMPFWIRDGRIVRTMMIGLGIGLLAGLTFESVAGKEYGRISGWLWLFASKAPAVLGRSCLVFAGSIVGGGTAGVLFGLLTTAGRGRTACLLAGFAISFSTAYTVNSWAFQRYFDPTILLAIGWCLASLETSTRVRGAPESAPSGLGRADCKPLGLVQVRLAAIGVFAMQAVFAAFTLYGKMGWSAD
ncbi:hypothetical protein N9D23_11875 [Rubripirellula sp.]|nr:hypothetical protein [Rubripirellula sp.]